MYPGAHAATTPDKAASVMVASGEIVTYTRLDEYRVGRMLTGPG